MDYNIDDFVVMHNNKHKYYCEAIIRPNGQITYAEPSHLMKLQTIWGVPTEQLYDGGPARDKLAAFVVGGYTVYNPDILSTLNEKIAGNTILLNIVFGIAMLVYYTVILSVVRIVAGISRGE